jgi:hypothetical protein
VNADVKKDQIMPEGDPDGLKEDILGSKYPAGHDHSTKS